jgi:hypothetical protein
MLYYNRFKNCDKYVYGAKHVSRRQTERDFSRKVPVSFTMNKELYDMVDEMIDQKIFKDRSHAINAAVDFLRWTIKNEPMKFYAPRNPK